MKNVPMPVAEPAKSAIKAVVFDLDGLMFNTEDIFNETGRLLLERRGKVMTPELLTQMMGRRAPEAFPFMIAAHSLPETVDELIDESRILFQGLLEDRLAPMPGLYELLAQIEARSLPKAVATSSSRNYLEGILNRFDLLPRFHLTLTAEDVKQGKPHPEIYLTAAERLGIQPEEMLVLEDSHTGTTSAVAARAVVVSIPHEHSRYQDFSHAAHIAARLDAPEILALLR